MKILIVEDQENLARLIKDGLESEGFVADYVLDGEAALARLYMVGDSYDLVLLDNMLPKKNGFEVCESLRRENILIPILMISARDNLEDIVKGLEIGIDDYLAKPFSFNVLMKKIKTIIDQATMYRKSNEKVLDK